MDILEGHFRNLQEIIENIEPENQFSLNSADRDITEVFEKMGKSSPPNPSEQDYIRINELISGINKAVRKKRRSAGGAAGRAFKAQVNAIKSREENRGVAFRSLLRKVETNISDFQLKANLREEHYAVQGERAKIVENELLGVMGKVNYNYHNKRHAADVVDTASEIAKGEGISEKEGELLRIAAAGHDTGFTVKYKDNEAEGAKITLDVMKRNGYSREEMELVKQLIIQGTTVPQKPNTKLQQILADADIANLGRPDFFERGEELRKELKIEDRLGWLKGGKGLIDNHEFFTDTAKKMFDARQEENRAQIGILIKGLEQGR